MLIKREKKLKIHFTYNLVFMLMNNRIDWKENFRQNNLMYNTKLIFNWTKKIIDKSAVNLLKRKRKFFWIFFFRHLKWQCKISIIYATFFNFSLQESHKNNNTQSYRVFLDSFLPDILSSCTQFDEFVYADADDTACATGGCQ